MTDPAAGNTLAEAQRLTGLSRKLIVQLVEAGLVDPVRGPRREYRFGFADLAVMRAARGLAAADLPSRRVSRALKRLRDVLQHQPQRSVRIVVVGDEIALVDSTGRLLNADASQYLIDFEIEPEPGRPTAVVAIASHDPQRAEAATWQHATEFEENGQVEEAIEAYRRLIVDGVQSGAAHANLGRLLHDEDRASEAEAVYRSGLDEFPEDATLHFNYAVLADAFEHRQLAEQHYRITLELDPTFGDAHYNLALLYEAIGRGREAIRHWNAWRRTGA
ncbi:hypothetical protein BH10PSE17_BH10PSE17_01710 [soil metagenome]